MIFCLFHSLESQSDTSCFIEHVNMTRKCTVYYKKRRYITRKRSTHNFREMSDTREMSRSMYLAVSRRRHGAKGLARGGYAKRRKEAGGNAEVGRRRGDCGGGVGEVEGGKEGGFARRTTQDDAGGKKGESAERVR